ncbi:hypothetical protein B566_EDAN017376 [Ephemera danica]|nr:hypothetical protein B566_EDAN017376 [Ephemera danica]
MPHCTQDPAASGAWYHSSVSALPQLHPCSSHSSTDCTTSRGVELCAYCAPPPTFEEFCMGPHDIREKEDGDYLGGDRSYAPRYPVYGFQVPK